MNKLLQKFIIMLMLICTLGTAILPANRVSYAAEVSENEDKANLFEKVVSICITYVTAQLYGIIGIATGGADGGEPLTIESLFFNHYSKTRLTIFKGMPGGDNDYLTEDFKNTINTFYKFFTSIAVIFYMMILVYIGIRVLLNAGTDKNAKYKEFVLYWVIGIAILFLFPYAMKYTIVVNDAFVKFIDTNKTNVLNFGDSIEQVGFTSEEDTGLTDLNKTLETIHTKFMNGTDYMSVMYQMAHTKGWLLYALCFVIMVKQLLGLIIVYFKRLLMTIFLMVIFPLVTVSYAIDKLGDGKSQAFNNWCKEFMLNVFMQSFHAIVYVIGMAMIMQLGSIGDNWLIFLMLISFISKGDELLRNIFNMKGSGAKTTDSGRNATMQMVATGKLISKAGATVSKKFGKDSHIGHVRQGLGNLSNHAKDSIISSLDAANARDEQTALQGEMQHNLADLNAPQTLMDNAAIALDENSTELERNQALDNILATMNMPNGEEKEKKLNELASYLKDNPEALQDLENMLKVRAAQNKIMVGGLTPVELNEQIEIILKQVKSGGRAGRMASRLVSENDLEKIRLASKLNFRKPEEEYDLSGIKGGSPSKKSNTKSGGTRVKGDRYSGRFRTPESTYRMQQARLKNARDRAIDEVTGEIRDAFSVSQLIEDHRNGGIRNATSRRYKTVKRGIKKANGLTKVRAMKARMKQLESKGKQDSTEYIELETQVNKTTRSMARATAQKQRGGRRTQTSTGGGSTAGSTGGSMGGGSMGGSSRRSSAKIEQPGAVYSDQTGKMHQATERKKASKKSKKTRDAVYDAAGVRDQFIKNRKANERATLKPNMGRPGQSAGKFRVQGLKYTGIKSNRTSAKNILEAGRTGLVIKGPKSAQVNTQSTDTSRPIRGNNIPTGGNRSSKAQNRPEMKDTSIHIVHQKTPREMSEAKALRKATEMKKEQTASVFADKFGEAIKRSNGDTASNNSKPKKAVLLSQEVIDMAKKKEEQKTSIKGKHSSSVEKPAAPASKYSTHSNEKDTVIVVRDGSEGFTGATLGKNVISLNSKSDYEKAKKLVADVENSRVKATTITTGEKPKVSEEKIHETAMRLAASITAINQSDSGNYTASEIVAHIDNIKSIMQSHKKGTEEYDLCLELIKKMQYDLNDFESTVRIQILNDPTSIAASDPNRERIMDASIRHVQGLDKDEILLTMLKYDQDELTIGQEPRKTKAYQTASSIAANGFAIGEDAKVLQTAMSNSLRERELQARIKENEAIRKSSNAAIKKDVKNILVEGAYAAVDINLNVPLSVGAGLMTAGMNNSGMDKSLKTSLAMYSVVDSGVDATRKVAETAVKAGVHATKDAIGVVKSVMPKTSEKPEQKPTQNPVVEKESPVDLKKAELRNKTTLGDGESLTQRAKRL